MTFPDALPAMTRLPHVRQNDDHETLSADNLLPVYRTRRLSRHGGAAFCMAGAGGELLPLARNTLTDAKQALRCICDDVAEKSATGLNRRADGLRRASASR